ncbi:hypothetical protein [Acidianus manzaensis]|uniref:Uncharacterized protein n=1 Tax=Acidianus manzaensis TaxID=282676 RepID=A0A1W6K0H6_9CREN|nr:hypothetical protein [Acidianus manzaensis]ARM76026.1 hypothetical protein B6F84_08330 [Acidianus manzaensis]
MVIAKFENGDTFLLSENGSISKFQNLKPDILIVDKLSPDLLNYAIENNLKIFECNKKENECLEELVLRLFPQCKSCKFM